MKDEEVSEIRGNKTQYERVAISEQKETVGQFASVQTDKMKEKILFGIDSMPVAG